MWMHSPVLVQAVANREVDYLADDAVYFCLVVKVRHLARLGVEIVSVCIGVMLAGCVLR